LLFPSSVFSPLWRWSVIPGLRNKPETHKEEAIEKDLTDKLKIFIRRRKRKNVDEILVLFTKKYPKYKKYRSEIYEITCQIMGGSKKK